MWAQHNEAWSLECICSLLGFTIVFSVSGTLVYRDISMTHAYEFPGDI